jgi:hypothetical protein
LREKINPTSIHKTQKKTIHVSYILNLMQPIKVTETDEKVLSNLSDEEVLQELKKLKSFSLTSAFAVGLMVGIIVYSVAKNTWGLLTLIPIYFIHSLINAPKNKRLEQLKKIAKERNLK